MKSSSSANATISSKRAAISRLDRPSIMPLMKTFSRPEISGWKPAPSSISADTRPFTSTVPAVGLPDAGDQLQHRALAGAVAADDAERPARRRRRTTRPSAPRTSRPGAGRAARGRTAARSSACRTPAPAVAAVDLADVAHLDRVHATRSHFLRQRVAQPIEDEVADERARTSDAAPSDEQPRPLA